MRYFRAILSFWAISVLSFAVSGRSEAALPNGGWDAAWSPDSSSIAFTSGSPHSIPNLWVIGSDRTGLRQLTTRGAHEPQWLPDGKTIVFGTLRTGASGYMEIDANGEPGSEKPVEALPAGAEWPVWSPDGSLIAYGIMSKDGSSRDLSFARANGGESTGLTSKFWCREWTWSPDGSTLAFVVGKSTGTSIWTANIGTREVRLRYKGFCSSPAYSPDGKSMALAIPDVRSGFKIVIVDLLASVERTVNVTTFDGGKIMWSADGKHLFFSANRKSEPAVWSVGADGKDLTRLTTKATPASAPVLSPNGLKIVFQASVSSSYSPELYVCANTGRGVAKLAGTSSPSFWAPLWSPGGKDFAFLSDIHHTTELYVGTPLGKLGKSCALVSNADAAEVSWAPDGKSLLLGDAGSLSLVKSSGGKGAAVPLPKLADPVQGAHIVGDKIVASEWVARDAVLSVFNLDGSKKRSLTAKVAEKLQPGEAKPPAPQHVAAGAATEGNSETGNPHSELGLMGPQVNVAKPERPATVDLWPAVSPNGKTVAFCRNNDIWLVNMDGTAPRQLTAMASTDGAVRTLASPCWSPDGARILFTAFNNVSGKLSIEIWMSGVEPKSERLVCSERVNTEFGVYYSDCTNPPVFTPDGKRILFTSIAGGEPRIASIGLDGTGISEIVPAPSSFPTLDAKGARLAYVNLSGFHERIYVLDLATGKSKGPLFKG